MNRNYNRGYDHGRTRGGAGYKPPGGTGFGSQVLRQLYGPTKGQKSYDAGFTAGKKRNPNRWWF